MSFPKRERIKNPKEEIENEIINKNNID